MKTFPRNGRYARVLWSIEMYCPFGDKKAVGWLPLATASWTKKEATEEMKTWKPNGRRLRVRRYVPAQK